MWNLKINKAKLMDIEDRLVVAWGWGEWDEMGQGDQKVPISSYKMSKSW